ncbi:MAG: C25 family cysteine peptidase [Candidatus Zixiibacteriota bacterium]
MNRSKSIIAFGIVFLAAALLSPAPTGSQGKDAYQVDYTAEFSRGNLSLDKFAGYDVVGLKSGHYPDEPGKPALPSIELRVALPAGMAVQSIRVAEAVQEEISGEFNVLPVQPPRTIGDSGEDIAFVEPDPQIYSSGQPYPLELVEFVRQADLAGQGLAILQLNPVQWVPAEKKLILYTSVSFVIQGVGGYECSHYLSPNTSERGRRTYEVMVKDLVQNPEAVELRTGLMDKSTALEGGPFDHVIITGPLHAPLYGLLVEWHNQKGVRDTVATVDWIYANYSGSTDQQKIRNFIIDANSTWGTMYFLLGGEHETVPFQYRNYSQGSIPSDQYYSDFNDNWVHDVFVGRVTAESQFEINTFIYKVLKYEQDPPRTDYPLDLLLLGMDYDDATPVENLKEDIYDNYIPSRFNVTKVYDSQPSYHKADFIDALNAGQNLVNHADHCNITVMGAGSHQHNWLIDCSDVQNQINNYNQLSIITTPGCHPNHMDAEDCIAEYFVIRTNNKGAVAFNGNTRNGLYYQFQWNSLSNTLDREWWVSLFGRNKTNLGQTLADAKNHYPNSNSTLQYCEWEFNLQGEPEMPIWTDEPDSFAVDCPSTLLKGKITFPVHVEDSTTHAPVESAYVCLWKEGEVYLTGYTDVNGDITLNPAPATVGSLWVTVTKHNYIPSQHVATMDYICGDINIPGGDGVVDVGDAVYLICYLYRGFPPPDPVEAADCNADDMVNVADVVCMINYLYRDGYPPCSPP